MNLRSPEMASIQLHCPERTLEFEDGLAAIWEKKGKRRAHRVEARARRGRAEGHGGVSADPLEAERELDSLRVAAVRAPNEVRRGPRRLAPAVQGAAVRAAARRARDNRHRQQNGAHALYERDLQQMPKLHRKVVELRKDDLLRGQLALKLLEAAQGLLCLFISNCQKIDLSCI